jgi:hypothetical protein
MRVYAAIGPILSLDGTRNIFLPDHVCAGALRVNVTTALDI